MLRCGADEIAALSEKYRLLRELRQARARGEPPPPRAHFQRLASRFPGALRELDRMPMPKLERRITELEQAGAGGPTLEWMAVQASFHELLRFALQHKGKLPDASSLPAGFDRDFLDRLARPPNGRLVPLVCSEIARVLGREVADVVALLEG